MMMKNPISGSGLMTTYVCSAACRHCMYCSSPHIKKEFLTEDAARRIAGALRRSGTRSLHIGGGEPFLNFDSLKIAISALREHGVSIDYIETNASWCTSDEVIRERLSELGKLGAPCVMASVDPFHIEFVPLEKPLRLIEALRRSGFDYFIWQERFLPRLMPLDRTRAHSHEALKAALGDHYVEETAREYGLGINGRALQIAPRLYPSRPAESWLTSKPCNLLSPRHCHVDLYEHVLPGGCPGIAIESEDFLSGQVPEEKYPVASRLMRGGINALYTYAREAGFEPSSAGYPTACALCFAMRGFLRAARPSPDIGPACFYAAMGEA